MNPENELLRVSEAWIRRCEAEREVNSWLENCIAIAAFLAAMGMMYAVLHLDVIPK